MNLIESLKTIFPNSNTSEKNLDNPDAILIQAPGWGVDTVPFSLASLSAYARERNYKILPLDLNVECYANRSKKFIDIWKIDESQWFWSSVDCVNTFIDENKSYFDEVVNLIIATKSPVVGFSIYESSLYVSLYLIKLLKQRDPTLTIIVGGPHTHRFLAGDWLAENPNIDAVVQSEGEAAFVDVIERVRNGKSLFDCPGMLVAVDGKSTSTGNRPMIRDIDTLPIPDFSDYLFTPYLSPTKLPMASSRGCPNKCIFCNEQPYWESYRFRSSDSMVNEVIHQLKLYPFIDFIDFQDSLCNGKVSAIEGFAEGLIKNKIKVMWAGQAVIRKEMTEALMKKLKHSGCVNLGYGLETSNGSLMKYVGKNLSKGADIHKIADAHGKTGLGCVYNVMFGLPGETEEDALDILEFLRRHQKDNLFVNPSAAFCGFANGTPGWDNPDKYEIDTTLGGTHWSSKDGTNTFLTRLKRFEDFCRLVSELNIRTTYPHTHLINRNQVIAQYYIVTKQFEKAIYYAQAWLAEHPEDTEIRKFLEQTTHLIIEPNEVVAGTYYLKPHSDQNWVNGVANNWGPAMLFAHEKYILQDLSVGKTVELANSEHRTITKIKSNPDHDSIEIFVDGEFLNGDEVGWPNVLTLVNTSKKRIIPIKELVT